MQEADAEINVVGAEFRGAVGGLEVDERFVKLGRAVMLGFILQDANFRRDCTTVVTLGSYLHLWKLESGSKIFTDLLLELHRIYANHPSYDTDEAWNLPCSRS